jgi:hypothetical protein
VTRFGLLACALAIVGFGLHWLTPAGSWTAVGSCSVAPVWAWVAEFRCDRRLARSLHGLPAAPGPSSRRPAQESHKKFVSSGARAPFV